MAKINMTLANESEKCEPLNLSVSAAGRSNWFNHFGKQFGIMY